MSGKQNETEKRVTEKRVAVAALVASTEMQTLYHCLPGKILQYNGDIQIRPSILNDTSSLFRTTLKGT